MDHMTAKVSCFARAYHYKNNDTRIFTDNIAEKLLGDDYEQIAKSMTDGYFKNYNHANPEDQMYAPVGVGYVYAVRKQEEVV